MEGIIEPDKDPSVDTDPVDDLDRLAIVEAELSDAEGELDAMDNTAVDQDPSTDL